MKKNQSVSGISFTGLFIMTVLFLAPAIAQSQAQCDIAVDKDNTFQFMKEDHLAFKTIVHHPHMGNDDAAHNVLVVIAMPTEVLIDARVSLNDIAINDSQISQFGNLLVIKVKALERFDHLEIEVETALPKGMECGYGFRVCAMPGRPVDIDYENNSHYVVKRCP